LDGTTTVKIIVGSWVVYFLRDSEISKFDGQEISTGLTPDLQSSKDYPSVMDVCTAVTPDEFPDTATVRRKVGDFERQFVAVFCDAFQCLAPLNQLAAVSVATRPDRANQAVSLLQYLESDAIPLDMLTARDGSTRTEDREFFLTIDPARHVTSLFSSRETFVQHIVVVMYHTVVVSFQLLLTSS